MSALRTTQLRGVDLRYTLPRLAAMLLLSAGLLGCGSPTAPGPDPSPHELGANDPSWMTNRSELPAPDTDRISYDARTRTLTLYDLPHNARWHMHLPGETSARPIPPQHRLPDVDMSEVYISYTRQGLKPSAAVTIKQIQESGSPHSSLADQK